MVLHTLLDKLEHEAGPVDLLMVVSPIRPYSSNNLLVCAHGYETMGKAEAIRALTSIVRESLSPIDLQSLARVTVLKRFAPFVQKLHRMFPRVEQPVSFSDVTIDGAKIESATIYHLAPDLEESVPLQQSKHR